MNNMPFAWLGLGTGLLVMLGLLVSGAAGPAEHFRLPVLTLLIINEFGFFVTAIGAGTGIRRMLAQGSSSSMLLSVAGCVVLALGFVWLGIQLWPGM